MQERLFCTQLLASKLSLEVGLDQVMLNICPTKSTDPLLMMFLSNPVTSYYSVGVNKSEDAFAET